MDRRTFPAAMQAAGLTGQGAPADPVFPYGAVYFRKSNPPEEDWARDHQTAARQGMNVFRHWFMWSAIEVAPGKFDWRDYDRMIDLAAANGIRVTIAEMITAAPEWMYDRFAHARYRASDDSVVYSGISGASATVVLGNLILRYDRPGFRGFGMFERAALDVTRSASSAGKALCVAVRARTRWPSMGAAQEYRAMRAEDVAKRRGARNDAAGRRPHDGLSNGIPEICVP